MLFSIFTLDAARQTKDMSRLKVSLIAKNKAQNKLRLYNFVLDLHFKWWLDFTESQMLAYYYLDTLTLHSQQIKRICFGRKIRDLVVEAKR